MQVTILGPNLNDQSKGSFHVHAAGCADIARNYGPGSRIGGDDSGWTIEASTYDEVGDSIYADMIDEGSMEPGDGTSDCHFAPCCDTLLQLGRVQEGS